MTEAQILRGVRLPVGLPVVVAGIRTAAVWTVGMATLATPVGATCLGNFIFAGLQTRNTVAVLVGCGAAALLALAIDGAIRSLEVAAVRRDPKRGAWALASLVAILVVPSAWRAAGGWGAGGAAVRVGAKPFTEQYILAQVLTRALEEAGLSAATTSGLGSSVVFDALVAGEIDCYVDYSGTLWAHHMGREDNPGARRVLEEVTAWLAAEHDVTCLGSLGFDNPYGLAVRAADARAWGAENLYDLAREAERLTMGADYEFFDRAEWAAVRDTYGLGFDARVVMDPALMYAAIAEGEVDVISAYRTDGRIAAFDLTVLDDPEGSLPPYEAVLLVGPGAEREVLSALRPLLGSIDDDAMRTANMRVDVEGAGVEEAAFELLGAER